MNPATPPCHESSRQGGQGGLATLCLLAEMALTETRTLWGGQQRPRGFWHWGGGRGEAPQGAAEPGVERGNIWHFLLSFKPNPRRAWGGTDLPSAGGAGLLRRACWQKPKWVSRHWDFTRRERETERFPPCPPSLLGPWPRIASPTSNPDPRAAAPLAVGQVFQG